MSHPTGAGEARSTEQLPWPGVLTCLPENYVAEKTKKAKAKNSKVKVKLEDAIVGSEEVTCEYCDKFFNVKYNFDISKRRFLKLGFCLV